MNPEIPQQFVTKFIAVRDINLAAMLLADDRVPRLVPGEVSRYIESVTEKPLYYFRFKQTERATKLYGEWRKCAQAGGNGGNDVVAVTYRAFATCDLLTKIILRGNVAPRPSNPHSDIVWTVNTKAAATALAMAVSYVLPIERLAGFVFRDGTEYGFLLRDLAVVKAFDEPNAYIAAHPDSVLSYVVAAFYQREALRDLVNQVPAQYIFRKQDSDEVYLVVEPTTTLKEIPVHA